MRRRTVVRREAKAGAMSEINITPLIDVLLVLLIIFMVAVPAAQRGLDVAVPAPAPSITPVPPTPPPMPVLEVGADRFKLGGEVYGSLDELERGLSAVFSLRQDRTLLFRSEGEVSYGRMVAAMDVARGAGVDRIGVLPAK
jgi:biopolymer transport protein TolR